MRGLQPGVRRRLLFYFSSHDPADAAETPTHTHGDIQTADEQEESAAKPDY